MSLDEFSSTAEEIANKPLWKDPLEGGGFHAYGIAEGKLEPHIMRATIGGESGAIETAHFVEKATRWVFGPPIKALLRELGG
jgi:hypothetical protein